MREISKIFVASVLLAASSFTIAHAQEDTYVSISGGIGTFEFENPARNLGRAVAYRYRSDTTIEYEESAYIGRAAYGMRHSENISFEAGYFMSTEMDFKISTESGLNEEVNASVNGFDVAAKYHLDDVAFKAGMHKSKFEIDGWFSENYSGTGTLFGVEIKAPDNVFLGFDLYEDIGGESDAGFSFLYVGKRF